MKTKDALLTAQELTVRLLYGVKCRIKDEHINKIRTLTKISSGGCSFDNSSTFYGFGSFSIKPLLRPVTTMTEAELDKLFEILDVPEGGSWVKIDEWMGVRFFFPEGISARTLAEAYRYLDSIMIDYNGAINKDIAEIAPEGMYK